MRIRGLISFITSLVIQSEGFAMLAIRMISITVLFWLATESCLFAQGGTWTELKNANPLGTTGTMVQLSDGTVIANPSLTITGTISSKWEKLTTDFGGVYINGTWGAVTSMITPRVYFPTTILPTGKILVMGGVTSYTAKTGAVYTNAGEIYDPVANTWTAIASFTTFAPKASLGNAPIQLLDDGTVLVGCTSGPQTYIYNPSTNVWSQTTTTKLRSEASTNESWTLLPDGSVLSYDVNISPTTGTGTSQRYIPLTGTWVDAGTVPVPLTSKTTGLTLGPMSLLPNNRVFLVGANQNTVLYSVATNTWSAGPTIPTWSTVVSKQTVVETLGGGMAPGVMLPNGMFLFEAYVSSTSSLGAPARLYEYSFLTNTITDVTPTTGALATELSTTAPGTSRMLVIPNGHALLTNGAGTVWDFAPSASPNPAWLPSIIRVTNGTGVNAGTYTLTGTQLTGISEGASLGSTGSISSNFPIVRLTDASSRVHYARTVNWTPGMSTGAFVSSVQFTLPSGLSNQTYQLDVIANGIPSNVYVNGVAATPFPFKIPFVATGTNNDYVTASCDGTTLTLTGDPASNGVAVLQRGNILTVQGAGLTLMQVSQSATWAANSTAVTLSSANAFVAKGMPVTGTGIPSGTTVALVSGTSLTLSQPTTAAGTGAVLVFTSEELTCQVLTGNLTLTVVCNFGQGAASDTISLTSVNAAGKSITIDFSDNGGGGNTANLTYCTVGTLTVDGGAHAAGNANIINTVNLVTSKVTTEILTNVP